jgi:signal peptidase I
MESIRRVVATLGLALATAILIQPYRPVIVKGQSMTPTLRDGQFMVSRPMNRAPVVGDIVLIDVDGATLIKRVAMVPGDTYTEGYVRFARKWIMVKTAAQRRMVANGKMENRTQTVPDGEIYLLGDNPDVSVDSRTFGTVPIDSIRGLVYSIS